MRSEPKAPVVQMGAGGANVFLLRGEGGNVLVDAGNPGQAERILGQMARLGVAPGDVRLILITHGHVDHFGSAAALRREIGAPVAIHALDAPALALLTVGLLIGTPLLSLLGAIGAALTLGSRGGGALLALLVLPLYVPALVFGAGAVSAQAAGLDFGSHLALLGAMLALAVFFAPLATAMAVRIALE